MIRVGICDDDEQTRDWLARAIGTDRELTVTRVAGSGEAALHRPGGVDVWVLDIRMNGISGIETCRALRAQSNPPQVLMFTALADTEAPEATQAGAVGFLYKGATQVQVCNAIEMAASGLFVSTQGAARELLHSSPAPRDPRAYRTIVLDPTDEVIASLLMQGASERHMADAARLTVSGLKKRLAAMRRRAGVDSSPRLMAALYRIRDIQRT